VFACKRQGSERDTWRWTPTTSVSILRSVRTDLAVFSHVQVLRMLCRQLLAVRGMPGREQNQQAKKQKQSQVQDADEWRMIREER